MGLFERGPADAVLALALVHHLAIGNNVPLGMIAHCFARAGRHLLIEFVPKSDSQVARLLVTREDIFDEYTREEFERAFGEHFSHRPAHRPRRVGTDALHHGAKMTGAGKRAAVLHPFLFSLFPILALYAHNIKSIPVPLKELAVPMALSLAATAALFLLFSAVFREPAKAGFVASLVVLWILSFGHLAGWIAVWTGGIFNRSLFFATAILVGLAVYFAGRSRRDFDNLSRVLNVVSVMLVLLNAASVAQTLARRTHTGRENAVSATRRAAVRPNIYYIVLDAYTRADILEEVFSFDNAPFLSALEARGFLVADGAIPITI